jgi:prepilin-type N-terminal cleavage/methylation domain-containing protein
MNVMCGSQKARGFTLIELLVVIAIIGILAAMLFPAIQGAMLKSKGTKMGSDGKQIWYGLFSENTDRVALGEADLWPTNGCKYTTDAQFLGASGFFRDCMASNWLEGFSGTMFAAPGVPAATNVQSANCAWYLVLNAGTSLPDVPFLISRNVGDGTGAKIDNSGMDKTLKDFKGLVQTEQPFGDKLAVVVTCGGSVKVFTKKQLQSSGTWDEAKVQKLLNPTGADNKWLPN